MDFSREVNLIGLDNFNKLQNSKVAVFGIGGVGSYIVEALARMGVGEMLLVDSDVVEKTNINRQLIATIQTIGEDKVEVAKNRVLSINPNCKIEAKKEFINKDNILNFNLTKYDFVFDAIDTITSKVELIKYCKNNNIEIISCMGTGNKLSPMQLQVADIFDTSVCPLAKIMRKLLRENNIDSLKVVYSNEEPINVGQRTPASISFVPSVAGLIMVSEFYNFVSKK